MSAEFTATFRAKRWLKDFVLAGGLARFPIYDCVPEEGGLDG
jgi:hypothetical protein